MSAQQKNKIRVILFITLFSQFVLAAEQKPVVTKKVGSNYKIEWQYQNFPLTVSLYELQDPKIARVGTMGRLKSKVNRLFANQIPSKDVFVSDGDLLKFAIVVENTTNKKIFFHVVPHTVVPEEFSLGTKFVCACNGHVYSVPPGQIWYRIVSLQNSTPKLGQNFSIQHKIIGIDVEKSFLEAKQYQEE